MTSLATADSEVSHSAALAWSLQALCVQGSTYVWNWEQQKPSGVVVPLRQASRGSAIITVLRLPGLVYPFHDVMSFFLTVFAVSFSLSSHFLSHWGCTFFLTTHFRNSRKPKNIWFWPFLRMADTNGRHCRAVCFSCLCWSPYIRVASVHPCTLQHYWVRTFFLTAKSFSVCEGVLGFLHLGKHSKQVAALQPHASKKASATSFSLSFFLTSLSHESFFSH